MSVLNDLAKRINDTSTAHGFWPPEGRNFGEMIALAHSELSEALEEHRDGKPARYHQINLSISTTVTPESAAILSKLRDITPGEQQVLVSQGIAKPEGAAVEVADCLIRCLDTLYSGTNDIDGVFVTFFKLHTQPTSLFEYNGLINYKLAENFGEQLTNIHLKLSTAWSCYKDGHNSWRFALIQTIALCMATIAALGEDIDAVVEEKMAYNESRPYKHGRAY